MIFGFFLRTTDIGAAPLQGDESWLTYLAYNFGHNGQRAELGVTSSAVINQPPFFHDVMAIPFAFDPDPRIARLFMAVLQTVGMAILYFLLRRYWTLQIALAGLLQYAVFPRAVWAGRFLWNPYLAIPFIIAFLAAGFLSTEGKRWARWVQLPLLACVIGAHPILATTGVLWLLFAGRDWFLRKTRQQRLQLLRDYGLSIVIAGLVLSPWAIGIIHQRLTVPDQGQLVLKGQSSLDTIIQFVVEAPTYLDLGSFLLPNDGLIQFPLGLIVATTLIGWLAFFSSFFLIGRSIIKMIAERHIARHYWDLVIGAAFVSVPALLLMSPTRTYDQYFIALVPYSVVVLAIILVDDRPRHVVVISSQQAQRFNAIWVFRLLRALRFVLLILICIVQLTYSGEALIEVHRLAAFSHESMPPLQDVLHFVDAAVRPGIETIYLVDSGSPRAFEQEMNWLMMSYKGNSRVIWGNNFALPVPKQGATYVGYENNTIIPELFGDQPARIVANHLYKAVDIPPNSGFVATCPPRGSAQLANGASILGYYVPKSSTLMPEADHDWTIYVLWKTTVNQQHINYQIFNHLVDGQGTKFAQRDLSTLDTDLWHDNDLLVSKVTLSPNVQLPVGQPLYLRVGMYTLPTVHNVDVINKVGAPVGNWVTIPICLPESF